MTRYIRLFCFTARACAGDFGRIHLTCFRHSKQYFGAGLRGLNSNQQALLQQNIQDPTNVINIIHRNPQEKCFTVCSCTSFANEIWPPSPQATWLLLFGAEVPGNCQSDGRHWSLLDWKFGGLCKSGITWGCYDVLWCVWSVSNHIWIYIWIWLVWTSLRKRKCMLTEGQSKGIPCSRRIDSNVTGVE